MFLDRSSTALSSSQSLVAHCKTHSGPFKLFGRRSKSDSSYKAGRLPELEHSGRVLVSNTTDRRSSKFEVELKKLFLNFSGLKASDALFCLRRVLHIFQTAPLSLLPPICKMKNRSPFQHNRPSLNELSKS